VREVGLSRGYLQETVGSWKFLWTFRVVSFIHIGRLWATKKKKKIYVRHQLKYRFNSADIQEANDRLGAKSPTPNSTKLT